MKFVVDIIILGIIVAFVVFSAKKGLFSSLLDTFNILISAVSSYILSAPLSKLIYDALIYDLIRTKFNRTIDAYADSPFNTKLIEMLRSLPHGALRFAEATGVDLDRIIRKIPESSAGSNDLLVDTLADRIGESVMLPITKVFVVIVLFVAICLLIKVLSRTLGKKLNDIHVIGQVNTALGGVLGFLKGAIVVCVFCGILYALKNSSDDQNIIISINESRIYNAIIEKIPQLINF